MSTQPGLGASIGRFQIEAEVGHGGMGLVYRAFDPMLGRRVAVKLIAPHLAEDEQARARFRREAAAAAGLRHPGVATVHEFGEHEGRPYIVFEWVEGRTLKAILAEERQLPLERVLAIFDQLCAALDHAHARGIVHRDIKPANVIIGPDGRATIVDFGLAWLSSAPGLTTTGTFFGTPAYMSPEQIQGLTVDGRSDLYSLAVLLYEMLAGRPPFDAPSTAAMIHKQLYVPAPSLAEFRRDLPVPIGRTLKRALAKEPAARFATAEAFCHALNGEPAPPLEGIPGPARGLAFIRKNPWVGGGLLAALGLGVLTLALAPIFKPEPEGSATPEPAPTTAAPSAQSPPAEPPPPVEGGLWPGPAGGAAQAGFVAEELGLLEAEPRWFRPEAAPHTGLAVGAGAVIYGARSADGGGILRALDWSTGELLWEVALHAALTSPPAIDSGRGLVYAATDAGEIYAFDLTGEWRWVQAAEEIQGVAWGGVTVAPDGSLHVATDGGWLHTLEPSGGEVSGTVDLSQSDVFVRRPAVIGSFVFAAGSGGSLYALDRASLDVAWTAWLPSHATTPPLLLEDAGLLFVGEQDGRVQAFTLATGSEVWAWHDGSTVTGLASDGRQVYAALASGRVVALDPSSGDEVWRVEAGSGLATAPLTDGSRVLLATDGGEIRYLDTENGEESPEMSLPVGEPILSAPAPAGGWIFVPAESGVLAYGPPP